MLTLPRVVDCVLCHDARVPTDPRLTSSSRLPGTTAADQILHTLAGVGVQLAFGLPGVHNLPFWRSLDAHDRHESGIRILGVRHEQTTVYAADGLARATGGLGVALVTSGPGAANTLAAVGEAYASGAPVLVIASDVPERLRNRTSPRGLLHESADPGSWFRTLTKAVHQPTSVAELPDAVAAAISEAMTFPRGPVYLGVPADILAQPCATLPLPANTAATHPDGFDISRAADMLNSASRPLIWVGGGAVASGAAQGIDALTWRLGAPALCTYGGRGALPTGHPLLIDAPPHEPLVRELLAEADLLLCIGSSLDGMTTANWSLPRPRQVIDINVAPSGNYDPDVTVISDATLALDALTIRLRSREPWADAPFRVRDDVRRTTYADPRTSEAIALVDAIDAAIPTDHARVCDMSVGGYWVGGYAKAEHPRRLLYPVGWGTLGYGLPAAIGVAAAGIPALAVVGDGGLAMALGELATVEQHQLPLTMLVVDDRGYGMLRFDQEHSGHPERGVDLVGPRWSSLGQAFGLELDQPRSIDDLQNALAHSVLSATPRLIVYRGALYPPRTTSPRWDDPADIL